MQLGTNNGLLMALGERRGELRRFLIARVASESEADDFLSEIWIRISTSPHALSPIPEPIFSEWRTILVLDKLRVDLTPNLMAQFAAAANQLAFGPASVMALQQGFPDRRQTRSHGEARRTDEGDVGAKARSLDARIDSKNYCGACGVFKGREFSHHEETEYIVIRRDAGGNVEPRPGAARSE